MNKNKNANNMFWVTDWIEKIDPTKNPVEVCPRRLENGKWRGELELPLINKRVVSTSLTEVTAMKNVYDKAAKLINEYMSNHPKLKIENIYKGKEYVYEETETGEFISAGLSERACQIQNKKAKEIMSESLKAVKKAIARIQKVNGSTDGIHLQVFDLSLFGEDATQEQVSWRLWEMLQKEFNNELTGVNFAVADNKIIGLGYKLQN